jgi:methylase of polypeptide subunit release factors
MKNYNHGSLKEDTLEYVLTHPEFKENLNGIANDIRIFAKEAVNEATLATNFELKLYGLIKEKLNVEFKPIKEEAISTVRHVKKGRIDSRIGLLIIEYKHHLKLRTAIEEQKSTQQIENYMRHLDDKEKYTALGVLTDGYKIRFLSMQEENSINQTVSANFNRTAFEDLDDNNLMRLIRAILALNKKALTPKNLVEHFGFNGKNLSRNLASSLYNAFTSNPTGRSKMLFKEWQSIFKLAHDDKSKQIAIEERKKSLEEALNISILTGDNETEYRALYAIQTTYAIIVKIIAFKVLSSIRHGDNTKNFEKLASDSTKTFEIIRTHLDRLESGAIFREEGFGNLLEGDFFAWYCTKEQWDKSIGESIKSILVTLSEYENNSAFDGENIQDLFKDLYISIIPDKVRHSLGEFYTPPWLAEHTIDEGLFYISKKQWTALDPCCGSGTFITVLIRKILSESNNCSKQDKLRHILARVKGIDLNPLAVLTSRINYFINISHLIANDDEFDVPIYLGDASYTPFEESIENIRCFTYQIMTEKGELKILLPASAVSDVKKFSKVMTKLEEDIENEDEEAVTNELLNIISPSEQTEKVRLEIANLSKRLVDLQRNKWNGIWARIICNFLTTANLGKFDMIVSNPPWIDWKNLPQGYRERIKGLCISRKLFSGDGITGGINLNICALISNVTAQNWLKKDGVLGLLMPENLIFQQSYEGFRNFCLDNGERLYFRKFIDWTKAGHPFAPVQHKFLAYFIGYGKVDYKIGVNVEQYVKNKTSKKLSEYSTTNSFKAVSHIFNKKNSLAATANPSNTIFSYGANSNEIKTFSLIAGACSYLGREGVEVYPQELFLLKINPDKHIKNERVFVKNFQNPKSKHRIAEGEFLLETNYLFPLVRGIDVERFHVNQSDFIAPFPYKENSRSPIPKEELTILAPNLMRYFNKNKSHFESQTSYNDKIIGQKYNKEFYALARVGEYSYGKHFVVFRDNTKWQAAVVSTLPVHWDKKGKRPIFQNHAVSISQREDGSFITLEEAHYICAVLNAPIVANYLTKSSDSRSFKIRPPINIPIFDSLNAKHVELSKLSIKAHKNYSNKQIMVDIDEKLNEIYLKILKDF